MAVKVVGRNISELFFSVTGRVIYSLRCEDGECRGVKAGEGKTGNTSWDCLPCYY